MFNLFCYGPSQIRAGYNVPSGLTGTGQTIVIVDAFAYPSLRSDLHIFDQQFGLPDPQVNVFYPQGYPTNGPFTYLCGSVPLGGACPFANAWSVETALDVQWAHAIAPGATIDLVLSLDNTGFNLATAEQFAVSRHLGNQMSMSFGIPEIAGLISVTDPAVVAESATFAQAQARGMSLFISAGDLGADFNTGTNQANYAASQPLVTSVGGTDIFLSDAGARTAPEIVWGDQNTPPTIGGGICTAGGATGGAPSVLFNAPAFQTGLPSWATYAGANGGTAFRTVSDVSWNGSLCTGVSVYLGFLAPYAPNGFYIIGGTSAGAPAWAGVSALVNQSRALAGKAPLGSLNPAIYTIAGNPTKYANDFFDITTGNNSFGTAGYSAAVGYDFPTGVGSPNVANLISDLTALP
jgi:subtilase family serine protease